MGKKKTLPPKPVAAVAPTAPPTAAAPKPRSLPVRLLFLSAAAVLLVVFWGSDFTPSSPVVASSTASSEGSCQSPVTRQLLIASHGRLFVYDVDSQQDEPLLVSPSTTLDIAKGSVFYSVFPSPNPHKTVYCALRGDLDHGDKDYLVEIDYVNRRVVPGSRVQLPSTSFTHEVVKLGDRVYCADTGSGALNVLSFPQFALTGRVQRHTSADHLNTLAPLAHNESVWGTFFNQHGPSFAALIHPPTGQVLRTVDKIGFHAHSWVEWTPELRVYLSSKEAMLCVYNLTANKRQVIYTSKLQKTKPMFLKGLTVIDNVAYFGESEMQNRKGRETVPCTLVAVDLKTKRVVFARPNVGSVGLINTISLLGVEDATYRAQPGFENSLLLPPHQPCDGYLSALATHRFSKETGYAFGRFPKAVEIAQLPYQADSVQGLVQDVAALVSKFGWTLRPDVNNYFILLVTQHGVDTDQSNVGPFKPVAGRLSIAPHIRQLFTQLGCVIGRTRLMMIRPGEEVKIHFDRTDHINRYTGQADVQSGYWGRRFRIHIPIQTHPNVTFTVGSSQLHMRPGEVFIFDNSKMHKVTNLSNETRVHLVIDTVGGPRFFKALQRARVFPSSTNMEGSLESLPSTPNNNSEFLFEDWADSPINVPMSVSALKRYFASQIQPQLPKNDTKAVGIFSNFIQRWGSSAVSLDVWYELLLPALCSEVVLSNGFSLYEALEPLARMMLYRCVTNEREVGALCHAKHD
ncbi:hypothetical protein BASA81_006113 [Batrachochytrium salamandrivorans]|nr:hypothetical protein BASA81_006113 [Batrachochytrium salamandrivorans]